MSILIKPIITEKATTDAEVNNRFSFVVNPKANKIEIKKAVETAYNVSITGVKTMNVRPNRKIRFTRSGTQAGKTNAYKKAIVQVAEGETIDFYENI